MSLYPEAILAAAHRTDFVHAVIPGHAPPAPRPRATIVPLASGPEVVARARNARNVGQLFSLFRASVYLPPSIKAWKRQAEAHLENAKRQSGYGPRPILPEGEPLEVLILVVGELPKSKHRKRNPIPRRWQVSQRAGDFDNLAKPVCDAATGILWHDDRQVARATVEKIVGAQGEEPRLEIIARPLWDGPELTRFEQERDRIT
jgi:Holliday junction resolvase RusA-like endonuclease